MVREQGSERDMIIVQPSRGNWGGKVKEDRVKEKMSGS